MQKYEIMRFNIKKKEESFEKMFEDAVPVQQPATTVQQPQTTQAPIQQPAQTKTEKPKDTKEDKLERMKQYNEYWNFERNYHFNSQIDSAIKKINTNYGFGKEEEKKLLKDIIEKICGKAAKYIGLSWDFYKNNEEYLFYFYKTNDPDKDAKIKIPYNFKFSNLHQKLLDWFLEDKERPLKKQQEVSKNNKPKQPSIKVVKESFVHQSMEITEDDLIESKEIIGRDAFREAYENFAFSNFKLFNSDENFLLYGPKGTLISKPNMTTLFYGGFIKTHDNCSGSLYVACYINFKDEDCFSLMISFGFMRNDCEKIYSNPPSWLLTTDGQFEEIGSKQPSLRPNFYLGHFMKKEGNHFKDNMNLPYSIKNLKLVQRITRTFCKNAWPQFLANLPSEVDTYEKKHNVFKYELREFFKKYFEPEFGLNESFVHQTEEKTEVETESQISFEEIVSKQLLQKIEKLDIENWDEVSMEDLVKYTKKVGIKRAELLLSRLDDERFVENINVLIDNFSNRILRMTILDIVLNDYGQIYIPNKFFSSKDDKWAEVEVWRKEECDEYVQQNGVDYLSGATDNETWWNIYGEAAFPNGRDEDPDFEYIRDQIYNNPNSDSNFAYFYSSYDGSDWYNYYEGDEYIIIRLNVERLDFNINESFVHQTEEKTEVETVSEYTDNWHRMVFEICHTLWEKQDQVSLKGIGSVCCVHGPGHPGFGKSMKFVYPESVDYADNFEPRIDDNCTFIVNFSNAPYLFIAPSEKDFDYIVSTTNVDDLFRKCNTIDFITKVYNIVVGGMNESFVHQTIEQNEKEFVSDIEDGYMNLENVIINMLKEKHTTSHTFEGNIPYVYYTEPGTDNAVYGLVHDISVDSTYKSNLYLFIDGEKTVQFDDLCPEYREKIFKRIREEI